MADVHTSLNRLTKWRTVFAGWQLGTRLKGDPECDAVRDHRELSIILRAEVSGLVFTLYEAGLLNPEKWSAILAQEAELLDKAYEGRFPGARATDEGMQFDVAQWMETTRGWLP